MIALFSVIAACGGKDDPVETSAGAGPSTSETPGTTPGAETEDTEGTESGALYGPDNAWWHATAADVPAGLAGTGYGVGDIAYNMTFTDVNGDTVELYQFYGRVVLLDLYAFWCGPCQADAPELEACANELADEDVVLLSVMHENLSYAAPTTEDLQAWAEQFGITYPLVADPFGAQTGVMLNGGYPTYPVLDKEMRIVKNDLFPFTCGGLEGYL